MKNIILFILVMTIGLVASGQGTSWDKADTFGSDTKIQVKLYPNPLVGEEFTIKCSAHPVSISVINSIGQTVFRNDDIDYSFNEEYKVNLNSPDRGLYLVKVEYANRRPIIKKLLIK